MKKNVEADTKPKLIRCAREEFIRNGFLNASLRTICRNADVTTGALYFFFKNKDDLFDAVVGELHAELLSIMKAHYEAEDQELASIDVRNLRKIHEDLHEDQKASRIAIHMLYRHREEALLLFTQAQGSKYEHVLDEFISLTEQHYNKIFEVICANSDTPPVPSYVVHWMSHMQMDALMHLFTHITSEEKALENIPFILQFLVSGFFGLVHTGGMISTQ